MMRVLLGWSIVIGGYHSNNFPSQSSDQSLILL